MHKVLSVILCLAAGAQAFVAPQFARPTATVASRSTSSTRVFGFFENIFSDNTKTTPAPAPYDLVTIDQDFRVAGLFLACGAVLDLVPYVQLTIGPLVTLLGLLFLVQTFRLRFQFTEDNNFQLVTVNPFTGKIEQDAGENVIVGGANRWECETIVNYDFFPNGWLDSSPVGPILVYFKETQTPEESWNEGPGESANDPEKIAAGTAVPGQVHFFPAVANAKQIRDEFERRNCEKL